MLLIPGLTTMLYTKTGQNLFNKYIQSGGTRQGVRDFVQKYAGAGASGLLTTQE